MRKYLIVAIAALTAMCFTTAAFAQVPAATMKVKVTPKNAGTKKKPKNSSINLSIANGDSKKTLSELTITSPKTFRLSAKGLTKCSESSIEASQSIASCPRKSKVGRGTAHALVGVTGTAPPFALTFKVTAVVLGPKKLGFFLDGQELDVNVLAPAAISGRKLIVTVPDAAQQPSTGLWAGLVDLETTMKARKGKNYLAATTGCTAKKMKFGATLKFADNTGTGAPADVKTSATSKCSK